MKSTIIEKIKEIISEYGSFGVGDVCAGYSPCASDKFGTTVLVEHFDEDTCDCVTYDNDDEEINDCAIPYTELEEDVLGEILELCEQWKETNE